MPVGVAGAPTLSGVNPRHRRLIIPAALVALLIVVVVAQVLR